MARCTAWLTACGCGSAPTSTQVNALLDPARTPLANLAERGLALRQVLALMIAQRRPSYYLAQGRKELEALTDSHIRVLAGGGVIDWTLRDAALAQRLKFRDLQQYPAIQPSAEPTRASAWPARASPACSACRSTTWTASTWPPPAPSTMRCSSRSAPTCGNLADPEFAGEVGLFGERLLSPEKTAEVRYSFTLFERSPNGSRVRVQTDNTDQPFDINEGSKLELGSTAKLRVLATYLEMIAELHQRHAGQSPRRAAPGRRRRRRTT